MPVNVGLGAFAELSVVIGRSIGALTHYDAAYFGGKSRI